ncbi:MAG: septal ring lytic transglycosylase RlpA family protein [Acidobacteriaceae bacterium]|nr:septal ring lytic transglycosylase RlpA family protein [Acidobacteriaceae bacterium]MBV9779439.1 septal ring lytic transglycosylase RlpA family protein [Acidobacteriaceae bacterium]
MASYDQVIERRNRIATVMPDSGTKRRHSVMTVVAAITAALLISLGCRKHHQVARVPAAPRPSVAAQAPTTESQVPREKPAISVGYSEEGIASWYGVPYHGRPAADGEIYDMETLVAAHRLLPFNTWLKVTNLANNKSVNVRVIDRGPFVQGRILDLSKAAARQIDLLGPGIGQVRLEVIGAPADIPLNDFYAVQIGAFSVPENAERLRAKYAERFGTAQLAIKQGKVPLWRVLIGKEPSVKAAQELATVLGAENRNVFVVRLDETVIKPGTNIVPSLAPSAVTSQPE